MNNVLQKRLKGLVLLGTMLLILNTAGCAVMVPATTPTLPPADVQKNNQQQIQVHKQVVEHPETQQLEVQKLEAQRLEAQRIETQRLEAQRVEAEIPEMQRMKSQAKTPAQRLEDEKQTEQLAQQQRLNAQSAEYQKNKELEEIHRIEASRLDERLKALESQNSNALLLEQQVKKEQTARLASSFIYSDKLISDLVGLVVKIHQAGGMSQVQLESERCYNKGGDQARCLYFDLAARKIDLMIANAFNSELNPYFDDGNFGSRLINVYQNNNIDASFANDFLKSETPRVNFFAVQQVNVNSFVK